MAIIFSDITEHKKNALALLDFNRKLEQEVKERTIELHPSRSLLQATLDSNVEMIQVFKAVRNEKGRIVDFVWLLNNATSEQIYGDVIGKSLLENNPGVAEAGIFANFVQVAETGIPMQYEKHYTYEQFDGWFYQSVVKLNDGVVTNTVNITDRKRAELQVKETRDRLQSIFDTTLVQMSILEAIRNDDNIITDLEIKAVNQELEKETGRKDLVGKLYATEYPGIKKVGLFELIVKAIETGEPQSMEYYYPHEGFHKWFTCMFVKLGDGVVATNMDISARKQAEEQLRQLEAEQQRQIFEVSLSALEEERQRISESLHNGIGQILYGVKINMSGFTHNMPEDEFNDTKAYTNKLLKEAITETRRISHEMMPTTLHQFGLKSAIDDICKQLTNGTKFHCQIIGLHGRLGKYMELAVYRTVQELMTNAAKHANATACHVWINVGKEKISIKVSDNGQGIAASQTRKPGIGLAAIRSKIKLLNGDIEINSTPKQGTRIEIIIPQPNS